MTTNKKGTIVTPEYTGPDRREDTGPWWASLLLRAEKIGYAGIAAFLIYIGAMVLTKDVTDIKTNMAVRGDVNDIKASVALHMVSSERVEKTMERILNVTVQQCINEASSTPKRDACFVALTFAPVRDPR